MKGKINNLKNKDEAKMGLSAGICKTAVWPNLTSAGLISAIEIFGRPTLSCAWAAGLGGVRNQHIPRAQLRSLTRNS